jgi:hypothetical protein
VHVGKGEGKGTEMVVVERCKAEERCVGSEWTFRPFLYYILRAKFEVFTISEISNLPLQMHFLVPSSGNLAPSCSAFFVLYRMSGTVRYTKAGLSISLLLFEVKVTMQLSMM